MPATPAPFEPAPLDPASLRAVLAPFGTSRTLPRAAFVEPEVLAWERTHFFGRTWVCVGRAASLAQAGDQAAVALGATGVLLVRDHDGRLRAFANLCRHRGHELLACGATAHRGAVQCPYHAWTYELSGELRHAPRFPAAGGTLGGMAASELALAELAVDTWGGWVFVDAGGEAGPLADHLGDLVDLAAPYECERLTVVATHRYELAANWKLVPENYHECYHCPFIHPELCRVTGYASGDNAEGQRGAWVGGTMTLEPHARTMSFDGVSPVPPLRGLDEQRRRQVLYLGLFPNLLVSLHPDYVMTHRVEPVAPDRSVVECQWLFDPEVAAAPGFDPAYAIDFWDLTNRQDWAAVESVQRGLACELHRPGPLAPAEDAVYHWLTMLARGYLGEPVRPSSGARAQRR